MPQRRLNSKLLLKLAAAALLAAVAIGALWYFNTSRNAGALRTLARQAKEEGELRKAAGYLRQYVQFRPRDQEGYAEWANLAADIAESPEANARDVQRALSVLETAVLKSPDDELLRRRLIDYLMRYGRTKDARHHLDHLLAGERSDPELKVLYGRCLMAERRFDRAAGLFYDLIGYDRATKTFDPQAAPGAHYVPAYVQSAALLHSELDMPEIARQVIDQMVAVNPDSFEARLARSRFCQLRGELDEARSESAAAFKLAPNEADVLLLAAEVAIDAGQFDAARKHLEHGVRLYPQNEQMYQALAALEMSERSDVQAALAHLARGLKQLPASLALIGHRAHLELRAEDLPAVERSLRQMEQAQFDPEHVEYLRARMLLIEKQWLPAARKLETLRSGKAQRSETVRQINLLLGQCYENLGQPDRALEAYRLALRSDARLEAARQGVQRTMAMMGRISPEQADSFQKDILRMLALPSAERDWEAFQPRIEQYIAERQFTGVQESVLRAHLLVLQQQPDAARELLDQARQDYPEEPTSWIASAGLLHQRSGDARAALKLLAQAGPQVAARVEMRLAKAALWTELKPDDLAARLHALEAGAEQLAPADGKRFWSSMTSIYAGAELHAEARRALRAAASLDPGDVQLRLRLFHLAYDDDNHAEMQQQQDAILALVGSRDDSMWRYCQAARLVSLYRARGDRALLAEAQRLVNRALRDRPEWNYAHRLQAGIHVLNQNYDQAITSFQRSFELGLVDATGVRQLVQLLSGRGRFAEAQRALDLLSRGRREAIVPELQAEIRLRTGDVEEGVELAGDAVSRDPDNAAKHLWYGQVLVRAGQHDEAEKALRRAVELGPTHPTAWLVLVNHLAGTGKRAEAEEQLQQAQLYLAEDQLPLLLAQGHELLGSTAEAESHYLAALKQQPENLSLLRSVARFYLSSAYPQPDGRRRARRYINQILRQAGTGDSQDNNVAWARRASARLLAASGLYPDLLKAIRLIEANSVQGRLPVEDQLLTATLLAARPEAVSRRKAVRLLEELVQEKKLGPNELLLLAQLHHRAGNWPRCREHMQDLLVQQGANRQALAAYCRMLIEQGQVDQARRWAGRLEEIDPEGEATLRIRAELMARLGRGEQAAALVTQSLPAEPSADDLPQLLRAISILQQSELHAEAERLLRRYVELEPKAVLGLADYLGRHGDVQEAFQLLHQASSTHPLLEVARVGNVIVRLRRSEVGDRYDGLVLGWLEHVVREEGESVAALLQLATLADAREDHELEERYYRRLLDRSDLPLQQRAVVLNNLAYSLALRNEAGRGMQYVKEAIALRGPTGPLLDTRAMISLSLGDHQRAISDLNLSLSDEPSATRYFHLALAQLAGGDLQAAHAAYLKAKENGLRWQDVSKLERPSYQRLLRELGLPADAS